MLHSLVIQLYWAAEYINCFISVCSMGMEGQTVFGQFNIKQMMMQWLTKNSQARHQSYCRLSKYTKNRLILSLKNPKFIQTHISGTIIHYDKNFVENLIGCWTIRFNQSNKKQLNILIHFVIFFYLSIQVFEYNHLCNMVDLS